MIQRRYFLTAASLLALPAARAARFPERPINLIVPFPPGGGTDVHLRKFAQLCERSLGQPVIVENRPGASGSVALTALARNARSDGYTISVLVPTSLRLPLLQKMHYDPLKDFSYLSRLSGYTYVVAVRSDSPWKTWSELVDYARANPGRLSVGNAGLNASTHLGMVSVAALEKLTVNHIPYKGDGDQIQDLLGGQVDVGTPTMGIAPHVESGRIRLLAVWTGKRAARFPDVPTMQEAGTNIVLEVPYGLVGPAGMDPAVVQFLAEAFRKTSSDPDNLAMLSRLDQPNLYLGPKDYAAWAERTYLEEKALLQRLGTVPAKEAS